MERTMETMHDRLEIMEICMSWHWNLDQKDWVALEQLLTPEVAVPTYEDAHREGGGDQHGKVRSRAEAVAGLKVLMEGLETQHLVTAHHVVELDGDEAVCVGHSMNMHIGPPQPQGADNRLIHANRYRWYLRRTSEGWRIHDHSVQRVWGAGNEAVHHNAARQAAHFQEADGTP